MDSIMDKKWGGLHLNRSEAIRIGEDCVYYVNNNMEEEIWICLSPVLKEKTPFRLLEYIGDRIGENMVSNWEKCLVFFDKLSKMKSMGGYVVIAQALIYLLDLDIKLSFTKA